MRVRVSPSALFQMINFLHNFDPQPLLFSFGFLKVYWYGVFIVLGMSVGLLVVLFLAKRYKIDRDYILDLCFYLLIFGFLGARIYDVFLEWSYYSNHLVDIFKVWQGGLAIHGGILAGILVIYFFVRRRPVLGLSTRDGFLFISSLLVVGLAIGQTIGRWGNYFNQELFGRPSNSPWSIFINPANRPMEYMNNSWFHPTFLYESLGCFIIFIVLFCLHWYFLKKKSYNTPRYLLIVSLYLILYSILRFFLEFVRIDFAPIVLGWRWPQIMSLLLILVTIGFNFWFYKKVKNNL